LQESVVQQAAVLLGFIRDDFTQPAQLNGTQPGKRAEKRHQQRKEQPADPGKNLRGTD
jgi:hypothetical protein